MEITTSWERRGLEQGLQQGQLTLILRQLARRIGPVDSATRERITNLPLPRLEELGEALLDFSDPADLTAWLNRMPA